MTKPRSPHYANIVFPNLDRLEIERKLTTEVKELQKENAGLKTALSEFEERQKGYYIKGYTDGYTTCKKDVAKLIEEKIKLTWED